MQFGRWPALIEDGVRTAILARLRQHKAQCHLATVIFVVCLWAAVICTMVYCSIAGIGSLQFLALLLLSCACVTFAYLMLWRLWERQFIQSILRAEYPDLCEICGYIKGDRAARCSECGEAVNKNTTTDNNENRHAL